jgi:hypothetical protein
MQQLVKERDDARAEAVRLQEAATKAKNDVGYENNPANAGSLAAKIQQSAELQPLSGQSIDSIVSEAAQGNKTAIENLKTVLTALGSSGKDQNKIIYDLMHHVITAADEITSVKTRMNAVEIAVQRALNNTYFGGG